MHGEGVRNVYCHFVYVSDVCIFGLTFEKNWEYLLCRRIWIRSLLVCAYSMNKILEKNLVAEMKSNTPGTQKGEQERVRLFNETSGEAVLPLAVLPREVVKLVLEHDVSPLGMMSFLQIQMRKSARGSILTISRCAFCRG